MALNIAYVSHAGAQVASTRYRILAPAEQLRAAGHTVSINDDVLDADITVFSKHWNPGDLETIRRCAGKTVFDVCDDHFANSHGSFYRGMCRAADLVTCNTPVMAERIRRETGVDAAVIPDPFEMPERPPKAKIGDPPWLLWFGNAANLSALQAVLPAIDEFPLMVVTNAKLEVARKAPTRCFTWSPQQMESALEFCDIVILPTSRRSYKSANRLIEAVRSGRFVIAGDLPAYRSFADWMWIGAPGADQRDVLTQGIAFARKTDLGERIAACQKEVARAFAPEHIGRLWDATFRHLANPVHQRVL